MIFYFVGLFLTIIGLIYLIFPSKKMENKYGYRTERAKMSTETYLYAQKQASRAFILVGLVTFGIGFLLKQFGLLQFFIVEIFLIIIPVTRVFYIIERNLEKFNDKQEGVAKNEIINDWG